MEFALPAQEIKLILLVPILVIVIYATQLAPPALRATMQLV
jgi:hypothetical protein